MPTPNDRSPFRRDDNIPAPKKELWIIRVQGTDPIEVIALSPAIWGIWVHWNGSSSEPCYTHKDDCPGCKRGYPRRWKGYLHVLTYDTNLEAFVELTPLSARQLMDKLTAGESLRGSRIKLQRDSRNKKGRILLHFSGRAYRPEGLPAAKDPTKVLTKLWGLSDVPLLPDEPSVQ